MNAGRKRKTGQENAFQSLLVSALPWREQFNGDDHTDNSTFSRTVLWGRILEKLDRHCTNTEMHFALLLLCPHGIQTHPAQTVGAAGKEPDSSRGNSGRLRATRQSQGCFWLCHNNNKLGRCQPSGSAAVLV